MVGGVAFADGSEQRHWLCDNESERADELQLRSRANKIGLNGH